MSGRVGTALTSEDEAKQGKENQIYSACREVDLGLVKRLVAKNKKLINTPDATGRTPLYYACTRGKNRIVDLLLERGADDGEQEYTASDSSGILSSMEAIPTII